MEGNERARSVLTDPGGNWHLPNYIIASCVKANIKFLKIARIEFLSSAVLLGRNWRVGLAILPVLHCFCLRGG
jgi:hypothetical protein